MEKISITTKDILFSKTILTIIKGELVNWGYTTTEIQADMDSWGDGVLKIEVSNGETNTKGST